MTAVVEFRRYICKHAVMLLGREKLLSNRGKLGKSQTKLHVFVAWYVDDMFLSKSICHLACQICDILKFFPLFYASLCGYKTHPMQKVFFPP